MSNASTQVGLTVAALSFFAACGVEELPARDEAPEVATTQDEILGMDLCKDVDLSFRNSRERADGNVPIRVRRVKFYSGEDGAWHSENFNNVIVGYGLSVVVANQDLENVYFEHLSDWKVYYNVLQANGNWGPEVYQHVYPPGDDQCTNYRTYFLTVN